MRNSLAIGALAAVIILASTASAQIPGEMNYQVMLTNDIDEPLADQSVNLFFTMYDASEGGTLLWSEAHNGVTDQLDRCGFGPSRRDRFVRSGVLRRSPVAGSLGQRSDDVTQARFRHLPLRVPGRGCLHARGRRPRGVHTRRRPEQHGCSQYARQPRRLDNAQERPVGIRGRNGQTAAPGTDTRSTRSTAIRSTPSTSTMRAVSASAPAAPTTSSWWGRPPPD